MLVCRMYLNIIISPLVINFSHFVTFSLFRKTAFDGCKITNFVRFYLLPTYLQDEYKTPFSAFYSLLFITFKVFYFVRVSLTKCYAFQ